MTRAEKAARCRCLCHIFKLTHTPGCCFVCSFCFMRIPRETYRAHRAACTKRPPRLSVIRGG